MIATVCPDREELRAFARGEVDDEQFSTLSDHLTYCRDCEETIAGMDHDTDSMIEMLRIDRDGFHGVEPELEQALSQLEQGDVYGPADHPRRPDAAIVGRVVGDYELLDVIGQGGMGVVYRARHRESGRLVAVKSLPFHRRGHLASARRFEREIAALCRLSHPNVVGAYDAIESDDAHFLVMELIDGVNLKRLLRQVGPLPVADACEIARQAALGLQHAHQNSLVHRDFKPSNLLVTRDGTVKVLDLGLALGNEELSEFEELTETGQVMGTFDYMAPEQAHDSHSVDYRADLYGLGCTLFAALTGRSPFSGRQYQSPARKILAHAQDEPPRLREFRDDVPVGVEQLVDSLLAKAPDGRPESAEVVADGLARFASDADLVALTSRADGRAVHLETRPDVSDRSQTVPSPPEPTTQLAVNRRSTRPLVTLGLWAAFGAMLAGIVIIIKRDGKTVAEVKAPDGSTVIIDDTDKVTVDVSSPAGPGKSAGPGKTVGNAAAETTGGRTMESDIVIEPSALPAGFDVVAFDDFDSAPVLNWNAIRHDPSHLSLTKNPGALTITTQRGTIHEHWDKTPDAIRTRNIIVLDNPLPDDANFVVSTMINGFLPDEFYQNAGLILYDDDDNYVRWVYEADIDHPGRQKFVAIRETDEKSEVDAPESPQGLSRFWLRISRTDGNRYTIAASADGKAYDVVVETTWDGTPRQFGLFADNGGGPEQEASDRDAPFEFFQLASTAQAVRSVKADGPSSSLFADSPPNPDLPRPSGRMCQPFWLAGREHRRESVVVDGDQAWAMFCACVDGDLDAVHRLINQDSHLIYAQIWYQQPIDLAIREGHLEVVKTLLAADENNRWYHSRATHDEHYRINLSEIERRGYSDVADYLRDYESRQAPNYRPEFLGIKRAIAKGDTDTVVDAIYDTPDLLTATDKRGQAAIHLAIDHEDFVLMKALIDMGTSLDVKTAKNRTPLDYAVESFPQAIPYLLSEGVAPTIGALVVRGGLDEIHAMVDEDPSLANVLDSFGKRPLARAAEHRRADVVKLLLDHGADPNLPGPDNSHGTALYIASGNWDHATMKLLLDAGADPNAEIDSSGCCLSQLVDHEKWGNHPARRAYELLVSYGAVDPADALSDEEQLDFLRTQPVEAITRRYDGGWSEFHHHLRSVEALDVYVERVGSESIRSLWWASWMADLDDEAYTRRLVHHGMDVNRRDWLGRSLLHSAAGEGNLQAAKLLVELGAELDPIDVHSGTTPLGYAAMNGHVDMVEWLLDQGADRNPPTGRSWSTPLAYARLARQQADFNAEPTSQADAIVRLLD